MYPDDKQPEAATPINPEIERRFTYHPPQSDQIPRYERIRSFAKAFAYLIDQCCPDSQERTVAHIHLDSTVASANAAIARNE